MVPDVNPYALLMGGGPGPRCVAVTPAKLAGAELPCQTVCLE
jgi:hypothetical protein